MTCKSVAKLVYGTVPQEFPGMYRSGKLNNGSFGACPLSIREAQNLLRQRLATDFDRLYFQNELPEMLQFASNSIAEYVGSSPENTCLVENATVATGVVGFHWMWKILENQSSSSNNILIFNHIYKACYYSLQNTCGRAGGTFSFCDLPFPLNDPNDALNILEDSLKAHRPRFAFLDHITSQPCQVLPVKEMIALCRQYGVEEIAIDGSHAVGSVSLNLQELGDFDWYFSNLHKWGFAPLTSTVLSGKHFPDAHHPIASWKWGQGLQDEASWTGTRDYSAFTSVPYAVDYLTRWQSDFGELSFEYNTRKVLEYSQMLAESWETGQKFHPDLVCGMIMVKLPKDIQVDDAPGKPTKGMRSRLRDDFGLEVAVANFNEAGNFIRLSHAIYNHEDDYARLRDAILEIKKDQMN